MYNINIEELEEQYRAVLEKDGQEIEGNGRTLAEALYDLAESCETLEEGAFESNHSFTALMDGAGAA